MHGVRFDAPGHYAFELLVDGHHLRSIPLHIVAGLTAADGGEVILKGNQKVLAARLSDAKFFYETDLKTKLEDRLPKFEQIVFHEKLGTVADKVARVAKLAWVPACRWRTRTYLSPATSPPRPVRRC